MCPVVCWNYEDGIRVPLLLMCNTVKFGLRSTNQSMKSFHLNGSEVRTFQLSTRSVNSTGNRVMYNAIGHHFMVLDWKVTP